MEIMEIIKVIRKMAENNFVIYTGDGNFEKFYCNFHEAATETEINTFENENNIRFPLDFKEFLLITNGMYFLESAELRILGLKDIKMFLDTGIYKKGVYVIASNRGEDIAINMAEIGTSKYLYAYTACSDNEFKPLFTDFKTFLDRIISVNTRVYWDWFEYRDYYGFNS